MVLSWMHDWSWGLPLLVLTIVAHVAAIVLTAKILGRYKGSDQHTVSRFIIFVALAAIASTVYSTLEAAAWAALYLWVGALPASRAAMLYSVSAMTSRKSARNQGVSERSRSLTNKTG